MMLSGHVRGLLTLVRSGVVGPVRPDRLVRVLNGWLRWGLTIPAGYATGAARHPDRPAIIDDLGMLTYLEVDRRTTRLAHGFSGLGVAAGTRVGVLCRNHRGLIETVAACGKLGAHAVLLNTGLSSAQMSAVLREQGVGVVVADTEFRQLLSRAPHGVRQVTAWTDAVTSSTTLAGLIEGETTVPLPRRPQRGRIIVLTSGTTGTPQGARRPEPPSLNPAAAVLSRIPLRTGEISLVTAPLFHAWGLAALQLSLVLGSTVVLQRRFEPAAALSAAERYRCTSIFLVPVTLQRMLDLPAEQRRRDLTSLRVIASSGSALPVPVVHRTRREFGSVLHNLYGSTEVSWVSIATPADLRDAPGTAGRPPTGTRLAILDEHGQPMPAGRTGRIFVANDMLFDGYTNGTRSEVRDGLVATGDIGYLDATGRLFVAGRHDEMIVSGGENVHPNAVEDLLAGLPGIREVAVVGVPDLEFGQRLTAYLVLRENVELEPDTVRDYVRAHLDRFSVPRDVLFLDRLPRNATGKVVKHELPGQSAT